MIRPPEFYLSPAGDLMMPAEVARVIFHFAKLERFADRVRGQRGDVDAVLVAMRLAGDRWVRAETGTEHASPAAPERDWVKTKEAAEMIGIHERSVRKACQLGRLAGDDSSGYWLIHREAIAHFKASRRSRA